MATRSVIVDKVSNRGIYCHWDGYPDHQMPILTHYYDTQEKVDQLIDLGDLSVLGINIERSSESLPIVKGLSANTEAYHRDRGEDRESTLPATNVYPLVNQFANRAGAEFIYTWDGKEWTYKQLKTGW